MNSCMILHASQKEEDAAREEWFATLDQRRREREAQEVKKNEQEQLVAHQCQTNQSLTCEQILPRMVGPPKSQGGRTGEERQLMIWECSLRIVKF